MHRFAAENAATRPYGFLFLVLEEAAQLKHPGSPPAVQEDPAFRAFFSGWPPSVSK